MAWYSQVSASGRWIGRCPETYHGCAPRGRDLGGLRRGETPPHARDGTAAKRYERWAAQLGAGNGGRNRHHESRRRRRDSVAEAHRPPNPATAQPCSCRPRGRPDPLAGPNPSRQAIVAEFEREVGVRPGSRAGERPPARPRRRRGRRSPAAHGADTRVAGRPGRASGACGGRSELGDRGRGRGEPGSARAQGVEG